MDRVDVMVQGVRLNIAVTSYVSANNAPPIAFRHGFGSTKEDFIDLTFYPAFGERTLIAYDAPGCGETTCDDLSAINIEFLVATAEAVLDTLEIDRALWLDPTQTSDIGAFDTQAILLCLPRATR